MNTGQDIQTIAAELQRQLKTRRDYIAPLGKVEFGVKSDALVVHGLPSPNGGHPATDWTHSQLATHFKIHKPYYDRMRVEAPDLLATNLNTWRTREPQTKRMFRTLDGNIRAFVSDKYRCLNSYDFALATLPVLQNHGAIVVSAAVTDTRLYLKAKCPWLRGNIVKRKGDVIEGGVGIRNSEVGDGLWEIFLYITRCICDNGAIAESIMRRAHRGKRQGEEIEDAVEIYSDTTKRLDDAAFYSKAKDMIEAAMGPKFFGEYLAKANGAAEDQIGKDVPLDEVVDVTLSRFGLSPALATPVLANLIDGGDRSRWGLHNALTLTANTVPDYELATELERVGGKIIDLSKSEWNEIAA